MEKRWIQAATILPPTVKVAGSRLLPFCLRHRVALEAINSPVLDHGKSFTAKDLIIAVRILSSTDFVEMRRPVSLWESLKIGYYSKSPRAFIVECVKLVNYLEAQSLMPRFWAKSENSKDTGIPWQLAVIACLTRNGCTLDEAWIMPEAEAVWLHIAHCRASGAKVDIVSDVEWEAMENYRKEIEANKTPNAYNRN